VIGEMLAPLLQDTRYEPAPGDACHDCPVRRWCQAGRAHVTTLAGRKNVAEADNAVG